MKINVRGIEERHLRPMQHVTNLFMENVTVVRNDEMAAMQIDVKMTENDDSVEVHVHFTSESKEFESTRISCLVENDDLSKRMKNTFLQAYLDVLTEYTGISQPWGILTGIRPTKLMHRYRRNGIPLEIAARELKRDYSITASKIDLMASIVERQLKVVPDLYHIADEVSIYIGIPYCPTKCAYCTFPAYAILPNLKNVPRFLEGLHFEIEKIGDLLKQMQIKVSSIYFGGGTPTSITAEQMDALYAHVHAHVPMQHVREVTVEAGRPDTITEEKLAVLKKYNIDRISVNPQSYTDETLHAIGRHHTVQETIDKYKLSRQWGMNNINMDLIVGLPGENSTHIEHSLQQTEQLMPESLTVHTLSFKRASEMTKQKEKYPVASRDEVEKMVQKTVEWTEKNGYCPYYLYRQKNILGNLENVGYAKDGQDSIYNILIMEEEQS
ncbi:MAG: coproporphyrinogen dehydrogenase HemZ, partial [Bacilli bacterium]